MSPRPCALLALLLLSQASCSVLFSEDSAGAIADADAGEDFGPDASSDAAAECVSQSQWFDTCGAVDFESEIDIPAGELWVFNTDTGDFEDTGGSTVPSVRTATVMQADGTEITVLATLGFRVAETGTLRATGSRALLIYSERQIMIAGLVDVSSQRLDCSQNVDVGAGANSPLCAELAPFGGDSGPGGSFGEFGGDGITGTLAAEPASGVETLRGGCPGGAGKVGANTLIAGGDSGGALALVSLTEITIRPTGVLQASGAGGRGGRGGNSDEPGGGGGSGGMLDLSAPHVFIEGSARLLANGGGGGGGGSDRQEENGNGGCGATGAIEGGAGGARGESAGGEHGGRGGNGGSLGIDAQNGQESPNSSHGAGGGSVGVVRVQADETVIDPSAVISPAVESTP